MLKERPILMSAPMVLALLADTKTQTRRVVKARNEGGVITGSASSPGNAIEAFGGGACNSPSRIECNPCPYGQPGDRLWVREAWRTSSELDKFSGGQIAEACIDAGYLDPWAPLQWEADLYRRNWMHTGTPPPNESEPPAGRYRHARFMPRWASRLTLEITEVRVQRLQEISEADAIAEGVTDLPMAGMPHGTLWAAHATAGCELHAKTASAAYRLLWESINGPGSWDANQWVWAISFKKLPS